MKDRTEPLPKVDDEQMQRFIYHLATTRDEIMRADKYGHALNLSFWAGRIDVMIEEIAAKAKEITQLQNRIKQLEAE